MSLNNKPSQSEESELSKMFKDKTFLDPTSHPKIHKVEEKLNYTSIHDQIVPMIRKSEIQKVIDELKKDFDKLYTFEMMHTYNKVVISKLEDLIK